MTDIKTVNFLQNFRRSIEFVKNELPINSFPVAYELILLVMHKYYLHQNLTVKEFFLLSPYSYTATRQHYLSLLEHSYIKIEKLNNDKRLKTILPNQKCIELISNLQSIYYQ